MGGPARHDIGAPTGVCNVRWRCPDQPPAPHLSSRRWPCWPRAAALTTSESRKCVFGPTMDSSVTERRASRAARACVAPVAAAARAAAATAVDPAPASSAVTASAWSAAAACMRRRAAPSAPKAGHIPPFAGREACRRAQALREAGVVGGACKLGAAGSGEAQQPGAAGGRRMSRWQRHSALPPLRQCSACNLTAPSEGRWHCTATRASCGVINPRCIVSPSPAALQTAGTCLARRPRKQ